ncbi:Olfactory receptor 7G2 [Fukomys damarensis]|uniref:Olfactory receptor 7G2 n=1 Tax=Fukomys damarensis TaxID=885580 RepID=A0A091EM08_FUKDA|nr:Olfactory receptor 7G2 [Fukomys damarensis]
MKTQNLTSFSEFHLLGFSEDTDLQLILFGLFLSMYLVTVLGNLLIILAVISDSHLHTPMYFFLSNLSFSDICFISTTVPKMIVDNLTQNRVISYEDCLTQMSFYILFVCMDHMLLTVMGYDRFIRNMQAINQTAVSKFFLLELTDDPELLFLIFYLFLSMYLVTMIGNLLIILAVSSDSHLHTPMYFFLSNLSFSDNCLITCTVPKMLANTVAQDWSIFYTGCLSQVCSVLVFGGLESFLLTVMAYDRYVAICHPLRFRTCWQDPDVVAHDKWRLNRDLNEKDFEKSAL